MYCNKCGTKLPDNSNFCYVCGNKVSDIEILFKEAKTQRETKTEEKPLEKKEVSFKKPVRAAGEFASMLDEKLDDDTVLLMDKKDKKDSKIFRSKTVKTTDDKDLKKKVSKDKSKNTFKKSKLKRFIEYMKEEETYDKSFFDKKPDLPNVEKQIEDLEKEPKVLYEDKVIKTVEKKDKPSINKIENPLVDNNIIKKAKDAKDSKNLEKNEKVYDPAAKKEGLGAKEKTNKPNIFKKISAFLDEEDEDRLLDLSYNDYHKLMKGQGEVNYENLLNSLDSKDKIEDNKSKDNKDKPISKVLTSIKSFFGPKENEAEDIEEVDFDNPLPVDPEDKIKKTTSKPYTFEDQGQTIRYSKTVIDSFLDKHEKGELKVGDFDKIGSLIEEASPQEENIDLKSTPVEKPIKKESESFKELKTKPIKKTKEKKKVNSQKAKKVDKATESKPRKNYLKVFYTPIVEFFKSIGKFFTMSQNKDKKTSADNIDIIMSSPVESSDTMPLILSEEERNILNKEIDKRQGKNKASMALKKSNAKIHGSVRKLLSYGTKLTLPLLLVTFFLCLWPISWLITNKVFLVFFSLLKYIILYLTIQTATNSAFKSIGLRLKKSVIMFFVLAQTFIYLVIDTLYIYITKVDEQTLEALLHVLSPRIKTMLVFILLAFLLLLSNYKKIKEKEGVGIFVGWYLVIALVITVLIILLELLLATIFWPVLDKLIF